jgi:serine protease
LRSIAVLAGVSALAVAGGLFLGRTAPDRSTATPSNAAQPAVASRLIIRFAAEAVSGRLATRDEAESALRALSRAVAVDLDYGHPTAGLSHVVRLRAPLTRAQLDALLGALRADPAVAHLEVDAIAQRALNTNDELFVDAREILWNLKAPSGASRAGGINVPTAWNRSRGAGITVAVLDTGIVPHADLDANVLANGYDFISADADGAFRVANDGDGRDANPADPGDWIEAGDLAFPVFAGCTQAPSSWHGTALAGMPSDDQLAPPAGCAPEAQRIASAMSET